MPSKTKFKCHNCNELYSVDARNRRHQQHCAKVACRKASKAARQARWLAKPENQNYFREDTNSERVRQWRLANPGYSRRKTTSRLMALQDVSKPVGSNANSEANHAIEDADFASLGNGIVFR